MGSNERYAHLLTNQPQGMSVYVSLDALFPPPGPSSSVEGLKLRGWAPGALQRWVRSSTGDWIGIVTFLIEQTDGSTFKAVDQFVPAEAMRPKT